MLKFGLIIALGVIALGVALQGDIPIFLERYGFAMLLFFIAWKVLEEKE